MPSVSYTKSSTQNNHLKPFSLTKALVLATVLHTREATSCETPQKGLLLKKGGNYCIAKTNPQVLSFQLQNNPDTVYQTEFDISGNGEYLRDPRIDITLGQDNSDGFKLREGDDNTLDVGSSDPNIWVETDWTSIKNTQFSGIQGLGFQLWGRNLLNLDIWSNMKKHTVMLNITDPDYNSKIPSIISHLNMRVTSQNPGSVAIKALSSKEFRPVQRTTPTTTLTETKTSTTLTETKITKTSTTLTETKITRTSTTLTETKITRTLTETKTTTEKPTTKDPEGPRDTPSNRYLLAILMTISSTLLLGLCLLIKYCSGSKEKKNDLYELLPVDGESHSDRDNGLEEERV